MNKIFKLFALSVLCLLLTACGTPDKGVFLKIGKGELCSLETEKEYCMGVQGIDQDLVGIFASKINSEGKSVYEIYLVKQSDSVRRKLFDIVGERFTKGFFNNDSNIVLYGYQRGKIYTKTGALIQEFETKASISQLIQCENGKYYGILGDSKNINLAEIDIDTGNVNILDYGIPLSILETGILSSYEGILYIFAPEGFYKIDIAGENYVLVHGTEDSTLMVFNKIKPAVALDVKNEENMTFCFSDGSYVELQYVYLTKDRELITLRAGLFQDGRIEPYILDMVVEYNATNAKYYVVIDEFDDAKDNYDSYANRTNAMISVGNIDLMFINALGHEAYSELAMGGKLFDMTTQLEKQGIDFQNYYPIALYSFYGEASGVYGINLNCCGVRCFFNANYVEDGNYSIENFIKNITEDDRPVALMYGSAPMNNLIMLLQTSESFWGAIDWTGFECDLNRGSFKTIVQQLKELGANNEPEIFPFTLSTNILDIRDFETAEEVKEYDNYIMMDGLPFDDGYFPAHTAGDELVVLSNSKHKEGAIDFISFLLGDYAQSEMQAYGLGIGNKIIDRYYAELSLGEEVVHQTHRTEYSVEGTRIMRESGLEAYLKFMLANKAQMEHSCIITEDAIDEYIAMKEKIRSYPTNIQPLLGIVEEELAPYFEDAKSLDDICEILESRINTYIKEKQK